MATRSTAGKLQALIEAVPQLEELAGRVQIEDETAGHQAAEQLSDLYRRWYSACLEALPEDLRDRFRSEYEGGMLTYRVKHFLQDPLMKSPIYREDMDEVSKKMFSPWQHPAKDRFVNPVRQQLQYLEQALARLGASSVTVEALELLERIGRNLPTSFSSLRQGIVVAQGYP
ncbi:hypothetical protein [Actinokineospora sp. NPDC004072]